jgi:nucleotide-binding universal stress UspA family protein
MGLPPVHSDAHGMDTKEPATIIAAVDGSSHSPDALALARALASPLGATVLASRVQPPAAYGRASSGPRPVVAQTGTAVLDAPVGEGVGTLISNRSAARELEWIADERGSLLIALGESSRSRIGRFFLGDTAGQLTATSQRPVAVAPAGYANGAARLDTVAVGFDGSPESRAGLAWAIAFARVAGSTLRILTVHEPSPSAIPAYHGLPMVAAEEAVRDELGRRLTVAIDEGERQGIAVEGLLLEGHAATVLEQQTAELDLLVVGARQRGPARAALFGSVSRHLLHSARSPLVVVPRGYGSSTVLANDELP